MRKTKVLSKEAELAAKKLEEVQRKLDEINELGELAKKEEFETVQNLKSQIDSLCKEHNLFCGVMLTRADIIGIVDLAMKTPENIKIKYELYFEEEKEVMEEVVEEVVEKVTTEKEIVEEIKTD